MKDWMKKKVVYASMAYLVCFPLFVILCILFAPFSTTLAEEEMETDRETLDAIDEELRWLEAETYVITPSKIPETIKKTAASITVVTDRQIRQMGAKHLTDVVERIIPSLWSINYNGEILFNSRGALLSRVLIMINGFPLYDADSQGTTYRNYTSFNMDNIKRIEFIRGPGSTLYGANAYHGVINIISKNAEDVDGAEITARGGSWDTQQYNILFGKSFSNLEIGLNFNYFKTHGHSALIKEDLQTLVDQYWYTPLGYPAISLAQGYTKEDEEKYDLAFNVKYKKFSFNGGYIDYQHNQPTNPFEYTLTDKNDFLTETYHLNFDYETDLGEKLNLKARAYRFFEGLVNDTQRRPPGHVNVWYSGSFGLTWPEGLFVLQKYKTSRTGGEIQASYKLSDFNAVIAGVTYEKQKFYDHEVWMNDELFPDTQTVVRYPSLKLISSNPDQNNDFKALFVEDVWDITANLRLTLGARYDDYNSFGSHFSPRAGLTWEYIKGYDLKLLYGHAFSVPGISEIFNRFPDTVLGPQSFDSFELSLGAEFTSSFEGRITFFRNDDKDLITYMFSSESDPRSGFMNLGESKSMGVEAEARYDFGRGTWVAGNYSYISIEDSDNPRIYRGKSRIYLGKFMTNIRLSRYLSLYVDCYHRSKLNAMSWDLSGSSKDRTIVNATLIARNLLEGYEGLELRGSVYNLFDKNHSEILDEYVPYGIPQPGIHFLVEARYEF